MAFHVFGNIFSKKKQVLINFAFFFDYLLTVFNNERSHNILLVLEEGAVEHILRGKVWLPASKEFSGKT